MNRSLPTRQLREHPGLPQLERQAKELLDAFRAGDPGAVTEVNSHYRSADPAAFALHDAQFVLARAYGFESWPTLTTPGACGIGKRYAARQDLCPENATAG